MSLWCQPCASGTHNLEQCSREPFTRSFVCQLKRNSALATTTGPFGFSPGECIGTPSRVCWGCPDQSLIGILNRGVVSGEDRLLVQRLVRRLSCRQSSSVVLLSVSRGWSLWRWRNVLSIVLWLLSYFLLFTGSWNHADGYIFIDFRTETSSCFTVEITVNEYCDLWSQSWRKARNDLWLAFLNLWNRNIGQYLWL